MICQKPRSKLAWADGAFFCSAHGFALALKAKLGSTQCSHFLASLWCASMKC